MDDLPEPDLTIDEELAFDAGDLPGVEIPEFTSFAALQAFLAATIATLGPSPTTSRTPFSQKISIRVPHDVLAALKARAQACGVGYQTLAVQILAEHVFNKVPDVPAG